MKLLALVIAIVVLLPMTIAEPDHVINGPYEITFDIGQTRDKYYVQIYDPIFDENGVNARYAARIYTNVSAYFNDLLVENGTGLKTLNNVDIEMIRYFTDVPKLPVNEFAPILKHRVESSELNTNIRPGTCQIDGQDGAIIYYGIKQQPFVHGDGNVNKIPASGSMLCGVSI